MVELLLHKNASSRSGSNLSNTKVHFYKNIPKNTLTQKNAKTAPFLALITYLAGAVFAYFFGQRIFRCDL